MPSTLLKFDKLRNIRDLKGMRTPEGRTIRPGKLIRSGHLSDLVDSDRDRFNGRISAIVDFRSDEEKGRQPDRSVEGAKYYHIPVVESLTAGISREEEADRRISSLLLLKPREAREYMCRLYSSFALGPAALEGYGKFLRILRQPHKGAVLWHCTAGKDRAGIGAVLIEEVLGIDRGDIMEDYLKTKDYLAGEIQYLIQMIKGREKTTSPLADEALGYLFGADLDYLQAFYDTVDQSYGSMQGFLEKGLGVTREDCEAMREMYLE